MQICHKTPSLIHLIPELAAKHSREGLLSGGITAYDSKLQKD